MKADSLEIFGNIVTKMAIRTLAAWLAVWIGFALAGLPRSGLDAFSEALSSILLLPLALLPYAVGSGWWSFVAIPLALYLGYRALTFIAHEGSWSDLAILMLTALLVSARRSGSDDWIDMIPIVGIGVMIVCYFQQDDADEPTT